MMPASTCSASVEAVRYALVTTSRALLCAFTRVLQFLDLVRNIQAGHAYSAVDSKRAQYIIRFEKKEAPHVAFAIAPTRIKLARALLLA